MVATSLSCEGSVINNQKYIVTIYGHVFPQLMWKRFNWITGLLCTTKQDNDIRLRMVQTMSEWEQEMVLLIPGPIMDF